MQQNLVCNTILANRVVPVSKEYPMNSREERIPAPVRFYFICLYIDILIDRYH